jgi:hypothetical protein
MVGPRRHPRPGTSSVAVPLQYGVAKLGASAGLRVDLGGESGDEKEPEFRLELAPLVLGLEATPFAWLGLGVELRQHLYPESTLSTGLVVHVRID